MKLIGKHLNRFCVSVISGVACCVFSVGSYAQVFGGNEKSDSAPNVFSTPKFQNNSTQAQKTIQFKPVEESAVQSNDAFIKPVIELSMDNFEILPTFTKTTHCSAVFHVKSTLNVPISNVSFRLKWPNMETPLSFDGIPAGGSTSKSYMLLGKGCYEIDTPPTVIVNRCRVKGITQEACTNLIQWVK